MILLRRENKCPPNQRENGDPGMWTQLWKDGGRDNKWYIRHGALLGNCNSKCHTPWASLAPPIIQDDSQEITSLLCCNNILRLVSQINNIGYCCKHHLLHYPTPLKSTTPFPVWAESQAPILTLCCRYSLFWILGPHLQCIKEQASIAPIHTGVFHHSRYDGNIFIYIFFSNWCFCRVWIFFFFTLLIFLDFNSVISLLKREVWYSHHWTQLVLELSED